MSDASTPVQRWTISTETVLRGTLALMLGLSCLSFIEPSPYEFFFILLVPAALMAGLALTRTTLAFFFFMFVIVVAQVFALFPYLQHPVVGENLTPALYTVYTVYLYASGVLFALILARRTGPRLDLCLKAYALSCVFAGLWGIAAYLNIGNLAANEPIVGRVAGPFKDPNVLGSYCILGALYLLQSAIFGERRRALHFAGFLIVVIGGIFLSFSRGSWGAMIFATGLFGVSSFWTAEPHSQDRRRLRRSVAALALLLVAGGVVIASNDTLRETFTDRAKVEQEYDGGETGRFGNQKRSIPMLIERPFGLGPFRFPMYFSLQPHNSYIGAFSDGGWIGGFAFILLVGASTVIALQLAFARSPFIRQAQVVCPALLGFFLQALQIDIDHWRFFFLMLGAVWGMRSALASLTRITAVATPFRRPLRADATAGGAAMPQASPIA